MTATRTTYTRLLPALILALVLFSCKHDNMEYGVDFSQLPTNGLSFVPYHEQDCDLNSTPLASLPSRRDASSIDGVALLRGMTEGLTASSVHQVSGTYRSTDSYGNPVTLSGAVYYPQDRTLKGIIVSSHYTVGADFEVPSNTCFMDAWLATKGYALVMPDYMGYGASADSVHPYMQADLTAHHILDMALAVRTFFAARNISILNPDIILVGYSQGAHASVHAMRMLEDPQQYPEYADSRLHISKCCVGGGPYYVSSFFLRCVNNNYIGIPCSVPMLLLGMNVGQTGDDMFDPAFYFAPRLLENCHDWILSKRYTVDQLNNIIGTGRLDRILTNDACNLSHPETARFYRTLLTHDVPAGFVPKAPMLIFHSTGDDVVPVSNAFRLQQQLETNRAADVTCDIGDYGVHGIAYARFLLKLYQQLP